jgi:4-aminobutyrate aminotransferase
LGAISPAEDTAAIIMEAIQSDGGEIVAPTRYVNALKEICDRHGIWLFFDEVKTGLGRTGKFFAFEHFDIEADGVSMAKPLGGGLPLSAVVTHQEILDVDIFNLFTLGGSPVPCAAALATLDVIDKTGLTDRAEQLGRHLMEGLTRLMEAHALIGDVRGRGLMAGIELVKDRTSKAAATRETARLVYRCYELGLLVIYAGLLGNTIEITPPLIIDEAQIDEGLDILDRALNDIEAGRFDDAKLGRFAGW